MKLIFEESINNRRLDQQLSISQERVFEIFKFLEEEAYPVLMETKSLGCAYEKICEYCNTLEEYTLCMHLFVFKAARTGNLLAELEHIGNQ